MPGPLPGAQSHIAKHLRVRMGAGVLTSPDEQQEVKT